MSQRKIAVFPIRQRPAIDGVIGDEPHIGPLTVAKSNSSRAIKEVDAKLQTDLAIERGIAIKTAEAQALVTGLYKHSLYQQNKVFSYAFALAESQEHEDAKAYALGAAHHASHMANEDISDITRLGAAMIKQTIARSIAPEPKKRGW